MTQKSTMGTEYPGVLVLDKDEALVRDWSRVLIKAGFSTQAGHCWEHAQQLIDRHRFHLVIMDLKLEEGCSASLLALMRRLRPEPVIAVVSDHLDGNTVIALHGQCDVAIPKPVDGLALVRLASKIFPAREGRMRRRAGAQGFCHEHALSPRETQVVRLAANGLSNKQIAADMACRVSTVITYWRRIFGKTDTASRTEVLLRLLDPAVLARRYCESCPRHEGAMRLEGFVQ